MTIEEMRAQIDTIDRQLVALLNQRFDVVKPSASGKRKTTFPL